jgi:hypothetical protein
MRFSFAIAALSVFALAACSDDDATNPVPQGRVRVVHAISDVPMTDVLLDGTKVKAGLAYKSADAYRTGTVGQHPVKVRKQNAAADLVSVNHNVQADKDYTIIAYGSEAQPKSFALTDDNTAPAAGKARVRVVHAADGEPNVDVYVVKAVGDLATATAAATNIAPGAASAYVTKDADTYLVIFTGVGNKTAVLTVQNVDLANGKVRTVVAVEKAGGGTPLEGVKLDDR